MPVFLISINGCHFGICCCGLQACDHSFLRIFTKFGTELPLNLGCAESNENVGYRFSKKPNQTDLKVQKPKTRFLRFGFQETDFGILWTVFRVVILILQHDRINSQLIFLHAVSLHF